MLKVLRPLVLLTGKVAYCQKDQMCRSVLQHFILSLYNYTVATVWTQTHALQPLE